MHTKSIKFIDNVIIPFRLLLIESQSQIREVSNNDVKSWWKLMMEVNSWCNYDKIYEETYNVILLKIHSIQVTFLEHGNLS